MEIDPDELVDPFAETPKDTEFERLSVTLQAANDLQAREAAIARGALLGALEADSRHETGLEREQRIARAKAYAAWEYDRKPVESTHLAEFGINRTHQTHAFPQGPDWKKAKK